MRPQRMRLVVSLLLALAAAAPAGAQLPGGALDPSFGTGGKVLLDIGQSTDWPNGIAVQPDGRLVVVGTSYTNNDYSQEDFAVTRHNKDGSYDTSFGNGGKVLTNFPGLAAVASSVAVQPDGKIVVAGGAFPLFTFLGDIVVARYSADGTLDTSFGGTGAVLTSFPGQGSYAFALALQPDGRIVVAGTHFINFSSEASSNTDFALVRYNTDGSLDTSFGLGGGVTTDFNGFNDDAYALVLQPDGKLVAVGSALSQTTDYDFAAARYLPDGTLDSSFGVGGKVRTDFVPGAFDRAHGAALQPDGKLVAAGFTIFNGGLSQPFAVARYTAAGVLDTTFSADGKQSIDFGSFSQAVQELLVQPDGKIVVAGYANTESSDSDFLLARMLPSGAPDTGFDGDGKVRTSFGDLNGGANAALLQPDGKLVAAGFQAIFSDEFAQIALARYFGDPTSWTDTGGALPGEPGDPLFFGTGVLSAGSVDAIVLANAAPSAIAGLFLALSSTPVPFKGGLLQPNPFLGPFPGVTTAGGGIAIPFTVPAGIPSGTAIWLQWAIQDAGAVQGVALSNAIRGDTP